MKTIGFRGTLFSDTPKSPSRFRACLAQKQPGCTGQSTAMLGSALRFGTVRSLFRARVPALVPGPRCAEGDLTWLRLQNWEIVCNWDLGCNGVLPFGKLT